MTSFNIKTKFKFGKHKGRTIKEVFAIDPHYIKWIKKNLNMQFSKEILKMLMKK